MKNENIESILRKFLENRASPEEIGRLEKWRRDHHSSFLESVEFHHLITKTTEKKKAEHFKTELLTRFDLLLKANKRKKRHEWLKYAAIFMGLVALGIYAYVQADKTNEITQEEVTIILGNGVTKETLKENTSGIVSRSNTFIAKQEGSKIIYNKVSVEDNNKNQPLIYHTLEVPYGKKFQVVLSDGTEAYLNSGSSLTYPVAFYEKGARNVVLKGEGYFTVKSDSLRPFMVSTETIETKVLGTQFNISGYADDEHIKVVLIEGSLAVNRNNDSTSGSVLLKPNQIASYSNLNKEMVVNNVDVSSHIAWKDGILLFKNEDFYHITKKLERHYDIEIEIRDDLLKKERYTGRFKTETIEEVLQGFQRIKEFEYIIKDRQIILTQKNSL